MGDSHADSLTLNILKEVYLKKRKTTHHNISSCVVYTWRCIGDPGSLCTRCYPGVKGARGGDGVPGRPGPKGSYGLPGDKGRIGPQGEDGVPGLPGGPGDKVCTVVLHNYYTLWVLMCMAGGINIYSIFSDIQKKYSGYPKKNLWYLKYWHINFRYLKKNSRYQK